MASRLAPLHLLVRLEMKTTARRKRKCCAHPDEDRAGVTTTAGPSSSCSCIAIPSSSSGRTLEHLRLDPLDSTQLLQDKVHPLGCWPQRRRCRTPCGPWFIVAVAVSLASRCPPMTTKKQRFAVGRIDSPIFHRLSNRCQRAWYTAKGQKISNRAVRMQGRSVKSREGDEDVVGISEDW